MKNNIKLKLQKWCYGGIDVADYHAARNAINAHNTTMSWKLNLLFTIVFAALTVISLVIPSYRDGFQLYTMFAIAYAFMAAQAKAKTKEDNPANKEMILLSLALFFAAILIIKYMLQNDTASIFLIAYLLMTSVCFIVPTCTILAYQVIIFAIYIAIDYATKNSSYNIMLDGIKGTSSIIVGNVIGQALLKGQIDGFNDLNRDGLTRIYNRRKINSYLTEAFSNTAGFAVAMFDIDNFKHHNDTYGHDNGDQVLIHVARTLERIAEEHNAFVGRYGGEEFLLIVHGEDAGSIIAGACEEARKRVASLEIVPNGCNMPVRITISGGYADRDEIKAETATDTVRAADDAMYQSKDAGRNCITAAKAKICKIQRFVNGA
jgi:diguanylate cyclase (GGDEF)-like protein